VARQHGEFLAGDRSAFDLPLEVRGREFDRRVWELVASVPYGETTTYSELALSLGAGTEPRDGGAAVGRNPLCIHPLPPGGRRHGQAHRLRRRPGPQARLLEIEHAGALRAGLACEALLC